MLPVEQKFIALLTGDATLTAIVPAANISFGPVDITIEKQSQLRKPQITLQTISESSRTVPLAVRDIRMQMDIWSRTSQLELDTIYEQVLTTLNLISTNQNSTHIFWQRLGNAHDQYESEMRIWHKVVDFIIWVR